MTHNSSGGDGGGGGSYPVSSPGGSMPSIPTSTSMPSMPTSTSMPSIPAPTSALPSTPSNYSGYSGGSSSGKGGYSMPGQDLNPQNLGVDLFEQASNMHASNLSSTNLGYYTNPDGSVKIFQHAATAQEKRERSQNVINKKTGIGSNKKPPNVNIQTGDVRNFEGTNYVTTSDLQNAVQSGVMQTMNYLEADGVRYNLGM